MQHIIYTAKYFCEICNKEQDTYVYRDYGTTITKEEEPEAIEWAKHFHWIDRHRLCAICGKLVLSDDLELLVNDGKIKIHKDYTDEYMKAKRHERFGNLLIVHRTCVNN